MRSEVAEMLPEYVMGTLSPDEMKEVDALVAASPALRRELDALTEVLAGTAAWLPPEPPPASLRGRLMATVAAERVGEWQACLPEPFAGGSEPSEGSELKDRFAPFLSELSRLFDLSRDAIRAVLGRIDDAGSWLTWAPGIEYQHFSPGARLAGVPGVEAGLVRLAPGVSFIRHRHLGGPESTFVLDGTMRDGDRSYGPGSLVLHAQDTVHDYRAAGDTPLVIIVLHYGIKPE